MVAATPVLDRLASVMQYVVEKGGSFSSIGNGYGDGWTISTGVMASGGCSVIIELAGIPAADMPRWLLVRLVSSRKSEDVSIPRVPDSGAYSSGILDVSPGARIAGIFPLYE